MQSDWAKIWDSALFYILALNTMVGLKKMVFAYRDLLSKVAIRG